jgi:hypothetical protein
MNLPDLEEIRDAIRAEETLARVADDLIGLIRPAIRLVVQEEGTDEGEIPIGASKLGGHPDLPEGWEWSEATLNIPPPTPEFIQKASQIPHLVLPPPNNTIALPFVAQIRLSELSDLLPGNPLPDAGILYFFYNSQSFASDGGDRVSVHSLVDGKVALSYDVFGYYDLQNCRVLYCPDEKTPLNRRSTPDNVPREHIYAALAVSYAVMRLLPNVETSFVGEPNDGRGIVTLNDDEWEVYAELRPELIRNVDHLLGYSQDSQPYAMEASYARYRSALFPELPDWKTLSEEEQQREYYDYSLLLQVEPHNNGMHFGRGGALFFFIRNADLARRDFSRVWAWVQ